MKTFIALLPAVLLAACATTGAKPVIVDPRVSALESQLAERDAKISELEASRQAPPVQARPSMQQAVPMAPAGQVVRMVAPPPRPQMPGPPQYFAWRHNTPQGCDRGPFRLDINNVTDYFVTVLLDGEEIKPRGAYGELPNMPPHTTAHVCLASLGDHTIAGVAYASRMGVLSEVEKFDMPIEFTVRTMIGEHQSMDVNDMVLWRY